MSWTSGTTLALIDLHRDFLARSAQQLRSVGLIGQGVLADVGDASGAEEVVVARAVGRRRDQDFQLRFGNGAAVRGRAAGVFIPMTQHAEKLHRFIGFAGPHVRGDLVEVPQHAIDAFLDRIDVVQRDAQAVVLAIRIQVRRLAAGVRVLQRFVVDAQATQIFGADQLALPVGQTDLRPFANQAMPLPPAKRTAWLQDHNGTQTGDQPDDAPTRTDTITLSHKLSSILSIRDRIDRSKTPIPIERCIGAPRIRLTELADV